MLLLFWGKKFQLIHLYLPRITSPPFRLYFFNFSDNPAKLRCQVYGASINFYGVRQGPVGTLDDKFQIRGGFIHLLPDLFKPSDGRWQRFRIVIPGHSIRQPLSACRQQVVLVFAGCVFYHFSQMPYLPGDFFRTEIDLALILHFSSYSFQETGMEPRSENPEKKQKKTHRKNGKLIPFYRRVLLKESKLIHSIPFINPHLHPMFFQ